MGYAWDDEARRSLLPPRVGGADERRGQNPSSSSSSRPSSDLVKPTTTRGRGLASGGAGPGAPDSMEASDASDESTSDMSGEEGEEEEDSEWELEGVTVAGTDDSSSGGARAGILRVGTVAAGAGSGAGAGAGAGFGEYRHTTITHSGAAAGAGARAASGGRADRAKGGDRETEPILKKRAAGWDAAPSTRRSTRGFGGMRKPQVCLTVAAMAAALCALYATVLVVALKVGPGRYCSCVMPFNSTNEDSKRLSVTWRVIGCHSSQETRPQHASG
jgi:hypothetical protein